MYSNEYCTLCNGTELDDVTMIRVWNDKFRIFNEDGTSYKNVKESPKKGEIYLPIALKSQFDCNIGDIVEIKTADDSIKLTVANFIEEPSLGAFVIGFKYIFVCEEDYELLAQQKPSTELSEGYTLEIKQSESSTLSITELKNQIDDNCGIFTNSFAALPKESSIEYTTLLSDSLSGVLFVFMILLFIITLIIISHSISTTIEMEYLNLGILKSQGFTAGQIRLVYILQYVIAQVIGAILGILLSIPATPLLTMIFQSIIGTVIDTKISVGKSLLVIALILLVGCLLVPLKTAKISKISPVKALTGGNEDVYFSSRMQAPISHKLLSITLALRQFTSNKKRYISIIIISAILVFFMMSVTSFGQIYDGDHFRENFGSYYSDIEATVSENFSIESLDEATKAIEEITPVVNSFSAAYMYMSINDNQVVCSVRSDPNTFKSIIQGRAPEYDNEIIITEILAEEYGIKVGDTVTVARNSDNEGEFIVSGFFQSTNNLGQNFGMNYKGYERLGGEQLFVCAFELEDTSKTEEAVDLLNEMYGENIEAKITDTENPVDNLLESATKAVIVLVYIISALFTLVTVNMICSKTLLKEQRDIGIYKAVGFTSNKLRLQFSFRFLLLSLIGGIIGTLIFMLCGNNMLNLLLRNVGITNFNLALTPVVILTPILLIIIYYFLFSFIASRKIKTVELKTLITE